MKSLLLLSLTVVLIGCAHKTPKDYFPKMRGCFLLYNLKTEKFVQAIGGKTCQERFPACSTFKIPLAAMAFDSGILKDENQTLKWDGKKGFLDQWNQDHNAKTWMRDSVVWFSQRLTPQMGEKKLKKYLKDFNYGNQDLRGGITQAWLKSPSEEIGLKISAYEQIQFMKKLWTGKLPISKKAIELTQKITFLENSPKGYALSGKTGSNFFDKEKTKHFGWFISHLGRGDEEYITITSISDLESTDPQSYGGRRSREITKQILADEGLW